MAEEPNSQSIEEEDPSSVECTFEQGLAALKEGDFEEAVTVFAEVLKNCVSQHGELAVECALPGYYYGLSLLHTAQASQEVLANEEKQQTDEQEQRPEQEGGSDLSLAWEALDCARYNFELDAPNVDHSRLADVHVALGDVACESSNFESAIAEYKKALGHLDQITSTDSSCSSETGPSTRRRYCEVHYKTCLAHEFLEDPSQAAKCCDQAIEAIQSEIASKTGTSDEEVSELKEIEKDLMERKEAIDIAIQETEQVKNMLRQMFNQTGPTQSQPETEEQAVINLGVIGRGKRSIRLDRIAEVDETQELTQDPPSAIKRTLPVAKEAEDVEGQSTKKPKLEECKEELHPQTSSDL